MAPTQPGMARNDNKEGQKSAAHDNTSHDSKGVVIGEFPKEHGKGHTSHVAASPHHTGSGTHCGRTHVWHNTEGRSFRGLNEDAENNEAKHGQGQTISSSKSHHHGSLKKKRKDLNPLAPSQTLLGVGHVAYKPSNTSSKHIHPTKERSDGSGTLGGKSKGILEVYGCSIHHGNFDAKTTAVLNKENPSAQLGTCCGKCVSRRDLGDDPLSATFVIVSLWRII
mmetsp:Transcript_4929/g.11059  ORF Transcript_4929/g.11059 Transcript_4929/m.11059 type:complete len:223 (-) Transcript_4929:161-829(-)